MKRLMGWLVFTVLLFNNRQAFALDSLYLGGNLGYVASPVAAYKNSLGFGLDLGFKTDSRLGMTLGLLASSHSDGGSSLGILAPFVSADLHLLQVFDFDLCIGAGPGFYRFSVSPQSETKFGINVGASGDLLIDENLRVGMGARYHAVMGAESISGSFWTLMMRVGYLFQFGE